jgi:hypothetical protein
VPCLTLLTVALLLALVAPRARRTGSISAPAVTARLSTLTWTASRIQVMARQQQWFPPLAQCTGSWSTAKGIGW